MYPLTRQHRFKNIDNLFFVRVLNRPKLLVNSPTATSFMHDRAYFEDFFIHHNTNILVLKKLQQNWNPLYDNYLEYIVSTSNSNKNKNILKSSKECSGTISFPTAFTVFQSTWLPLQGSWSNHPTWPQAPLYFCEKEDSVDCFSQGLLTLFIII